MAVSDDQHLDVNY